MSDEPYIAYRCRTCDQVVTQDCDFPYFDETAEYRHETVDQTDCVAVCSCGEQCTFTITAYGANYCEVVAQGDREITVMLYRPPSIEDEEQYEMFLDPPDLDDPYRIFLRSSSGLAALGRVDVQAERLEQAQFRMLYANHIAILEAYLCDRLIDLVAYDDEVLRKFVLKHKNLKSMTVPVHSVLGHPGIARKSALDYLRNFLYHKLNDVGGIYRDAFDIDIFTNVARKEALAEMVKVRHDLVHRNGRSKDGQLHTIQPIDLSRVGQAVAVLVHETENALEHLIKMKRFKQFENPPPATPEPINWDDVSEEEVVAALGDQ
ncbi:hypothetical protein LPJGGPFB_01074 [Ensifer adhaerens]|uniref:hypothetical protein n=1 Tax=Ensifer adhaerens TaxID=106592 RepID=UPI0015697C8F|nr:hypothetical protein [Ensifer adhaerens]NRP17847.1 hypothetical protein [Ensifer adhaerens]